MAKPEDTLIIETTKGTVTVEMRPDLAPQHVARIKELARQHFYDGVPFHRVIEGFMAQTGDPTGTGTGGSGKKLKAEFNAEPHTRGAVSMARAQSPDSADSQFFIVFDDATFLDKKYTVWGRVIGGMENVDKIKRGEPPSNPDKILSVRVAADAGLSASVVRVAEFDFDLPEELIALRPASPRDAARLLVVDPSAAAADTRSHDARPSGAASAGRRARVQRHQGDSGRARGHSHARWNGSACLGHADRAARRSSLAGARASGEAAQGRRSHHLRRGWQCLPAREPCRDGRGAGRGGRGDARLRSCGRRARRRRSEAQGAMPLPPYIASRRAADERDRSDYQTVFAREEGAVAAPTAGLHFTDRLMQALDARGLSRHFVTLHVGPGTFLPVRTADTADHVMHEEHGSITAETAEALNAVKASGGKIVAVGTTSLRLLESATGPDGKLAPFDGETGLFITPGYDSASLIASSPISICRARPCSCWSRPLPGSI